MPDTPITDQLGGVTTFGRLTVIGEGQPYTDPRGFRLRRALCRCDCGREVSIAPSRLRSGKATGCGCRIGRNLRTHGCATVSIRMPEYRAWLAMRRRCYDAKFKGYPDYGGRGIRVCPQWRNDFAWFLADVGPRPSPKHVLGRANVWGHYEPRNVAWATHREQARKSPRVHWCVYQGERMLVMDACERAGVNMNSVRATAVKKGLTVGEVFAEYVAGKRRSKREGGVVPMK